MLHVGERGGEKNPTSWFINSIDFYRTEMKPVCAVVKFRGDSEVGSLFIAPLG